MNLKEYYESRIIGVVEPMTIESIGTFDAKVDSGNDGYNVIDGQNIVTSGNRTDGHTDIEFSFAKKRIKTKIVEFIDVHIGDSKIDKRPVIKLDIKFNGKIFKGVLFSVANREMNEYKILVSRDFISKNKYLIDVNQ